MRHPARGPARAGIAGRANAAVGRPQSGRHHDARRGIEPWRAPRYLPARTLMCDSCTFSIASSFCSRLSI
jgi:hypothetical protein